MGFNGYNSVPLHHEPDSSRWFDYAALNAIGVSAEFKDTNGDGVLDVRLDSRAYAHKTSEFEGIKPGEISKPIDINGDGTHESLMVAGSDVIVLKWNRGNGEYDVDSVRAPSWQFLLPQSNCDVCNNPQPGDTAFIFVNKPFLKEDIYEFTTKASRIDPVKANQDRWESNIKVVPNLIWSICI